MRAYILLLLFIILAFGIASVSISGANGIPKETEQSMKKQHTNRLINEASPYLRQHAHNPVDWYPWGEEAFTKARKENKPIILSIGYSTCYWCHVMEREVFERDDMARLMNDNFVSIKVDREQRPDVDDIYMAATQIMTGGGGWPNNVFLTPDLKPFYAGTYFPPEGSRGRPGWTEVLNELTRMWKDESDKIDTQANTMVSYIRQNFSTRNSPDDSVLSNRDIAENLYRHYTSFYDSRDGGFYQAPKFPQEDALAFILAYDEQKKINGIMARSSLEKMAVGGIHDHIGGGFHRYATDSQWQVPHFEKMLYNQALLIENYLALYQSNPDPVTLYTIRNIFRFVDQVMTHPDGGFYSALDAETDAVEGAYYTWTVEELKTVLGDGGYRTLDQYFNFANLPEIPGHAHNKGQVLYLEKPLSEEGLKELSPLMSRLFDVRLKRKLPHLDDKIITAWNGLMIESYADAGRILEDKGYTAHAEKGADFVLSHLKREDGHLNRIYANGKADVPGTLEDYSYFTKGLLSVYRATGKKKYLNEAMILADKTEELFADKDGGGYFFTENAQNLLVRIKDGKDSATPSPNAVMAHTLTELYRITGEEKWKTRAISLFASFGRDMQASPHRYAHLAHRLLRYQNPETIETPKIALPQPQVSERSLIQDSADKVKVHIALDPENPVAGAPFKVRVTLDIEEGWHVNVHEPPLDFLIPTSVDVRSDHPLSVLKSEYPEPHMLDTPLNETPLPVYGGKAEITLTAVFKERFSGPVTLHIPIRIQACKDTTCLPPADIAESLEINPQATTEAPHKKKHGGKHGKC